MCLDSQAKALKLSWMKRLLDPAPHAWKDFVFERIIEELGWTQYSPRQILISDLKDLHKTHMDETRLDKTSGFWHTVLEEWGALPRPTPAAPQTSTTAPPPVEAVMAEPLWWNPKAPALPANASRNERLQYEVAAKALTAVGFTHVRDVMRHVTVHPRDANATTHTLKAHGIAFRALRKDERPDG